MGPPRPHRQRTHCALQPGRRLWEHSTGPSQGQGGGQQQRQPRQEQAQELGVEAAEAVEAVVGEAAQQQRQHALH